MPDMPSHRARADEVGGASRHGCGVGFDLEFRRGDGLAFGTDRLGQVVPQIIEQSSVRREGLHVDLDQDPAGHRAAPAPYIPAMLNFMNDA